MSGVDRRAFVRSAAGGMVAVTPLATLLAGCAALAVRTVPLVGGRLELALVHYPELAEPGGSLKVLPAGHSTPIYVMAVAREQWIALSPICTHLGCTVEIEGGRIVCPCHGSTYDHAGRVLQGPAERALARYPLELTRDGILVIDVERRS